MSVRVNGKMLVTQGLKDALRFLHAFLFALFAFEHTEVFYASFFSDLGSGFQLIDGWIWRHIIVYQWSLFALDSEQ